MADEAEPVRAILEQNFGLVDRKGLYEENSYVCDGRDLGL